MPILDINQFLKKIEEPCNFNKIETVTKKLNKQETVEAFDVYEVISSFKKDKDSILSKKKKRLSRSLKNYLSNKYGSYKGD